MPKKRHCLKISVSEEQFLKAYQTFKIQAMSQDNPNAQQTDSWFRFCKNVLSEQKDNPAALQIDVESTQAFIHFLYQHGIEALLLDLLEQQNCSDLLPDFIIEKLAEFRRLVHIEEIYRKQHLSNLLQTLKSDQIDCLILKGTALAYSFYDKSYQRPRCDVDIFIRKNHADLVASKLKNMNFSKMLSVSGDLISHQSTYSEIQNKINHFYDIHWKLSHMSAYADKLAFEPLYKTRVQLKSISPDAFRLNNVYLFLHATIHFYGNPPELHNRLIWLYDLHLICRKLQDDDWKSLLTISGELKLDHLCTHILSRCREVFDTPVPKYVIDHFSQRDEPPNRLEKKRISGKRWSTFDQFKSDWEVLTTTQRIRLIKEHLFPPVQFILEQNNSSNRLMIPYFYIKRIFAGIIKLLK